MTKNNIAVRVLIQNIEIPNVLKFRFPMVQFWNGWSELYDMYVKQIVTKKRQNVWLDLYHITKLISLDVLNHEFVDFKKLMKVQFLKNGKTNLSVTFGAECRACTKLYLECFVQGCVQDRAQVIKMASSPKHQITVRLGAKALSHPSNSELVNCTKRLTSQVLLS